ncbi:hypothetical protein L218DRAFT_466071 [Marasmius fiardii PR-910]|nr:hypothetical protein L218DRAFT_466071 [Marasmius fiardii PR-910]
MHPRQSSTRFLQANESLDLSRVLGNAPDKIKRIMLTNFPGANGPHIERKGYSREVAKRMVVTEISILNHPEEPSKKIGRVVFESEVKEDMINRSRTMHGGCTAFLVDVCSSMAFIILAMSNGADFNLTTLSLNVAYHSPAVVGDKLRIVNTTITTGSRARSARTEVWNDTNHRLVASGVHIKMPPSEVSKL